MDYQQTRDDIEKTLGSVPGFFDGVPQDMLVQMWPLMKMYAPGKSVIPAKYRELISLAAATALKCSPCETYHDAAAKTSGATEQELVEVRAIVGQVTFWSSMMHTINYDMGAFLKEFQAMAGRFTKPG